MKTITFTSNDMDHNDRILAAIADLDSQKVPNYEATAKKYDLVRTTLWRRHTSQTVSRSEATTEFRQALNAAQEKVLLGHIGRLVIRGTPPTPAVVRNIAEEIHGGELGKHWVTRFIHRHSLHLKSMYMRNIENLRKKAEYAPMFQLFYKLLIAAMEKYRITAENMYNFDEKRFMIGVGQAVKRIMTREELRSGEIIGASQDGNREWVSLLAGICVIPDVIPLALIYQGESGDLRDSWIEDLGEEKVHFAATPTGWSCNSIGQQWLETMFDRYTKTKAGRGYRLLLVDGHCSHVNLSFFDYADKHRIIVLVLPSHSTHRLQPLDVGLFSPLSRAYSKEISDYFMKGQGFVSMSKRSFYGFFKRAWEVSFTSENIESAWRATGIWPYNPEKTLAICRAPKLPTTPIKKTHVRFAINTPLSSHAMRQLARNGHLNPQDAYIQALLRGSEQLAAQVSCLQFENKGLLEALKVEKKKRARGKRLNLVGEEDNGPQLFSPSRVKAARDFISAKEQEIDQRKKLAEEKKIQQQEKKAREEIEKKARADARIASKILREEEKRKQKEEVAAKKAEREAKKAEEMITKVTQQSIKKNSRVVPKKKSSTQITPKLCLQSENRDADLEPLANADGEEDGSTSLGSSRGVRDMGGVERLQVIEKRTRTRAVRLPQRLRD